MEWNAETQKRKVYFFLREQSAQRVAFSSVFFAFSLNYSSASLRLCVRFFRKPILFYYKKLFWIYRAMLWDKTDSKAESTFY